VRTFDGITIPRNPPYLLNRRDRKYWQDREITRTPGDRGRSPLQQNKVSVAPHNFVSGQVSHPPAAPSPS